MELKVSLFDPLTPEYTLPLMANQFSLIEYL